MDTHFADPYTAWKHRNQRTPQRPEPTLPTHTHRFPNHNRQRDPRGHHRDQQPTPENTSTRQHQQKPTNTTHNHTTTVVRLKLEHDRSSRPATVLAASQLTGPCGVRIRDSFRLRRPRG